MELSRMQITVTPIKKPKRFRSAFTTEQIDFLERQFKKYPYISSEHRKDIATALNMQERAVKIWFQNRRMKEKKETSNKELDYVAEESSKDRLINESTLPSANEQLSYSLPMIVKPVNTTSFTKPNTDNILRGTQEIVAQQEPQNLSINHSKLPINTHYQDIKHQIPFLNITERNEPKKLFKKSVLKKPAESNELSKKLKRLRKEVNQDHKLKVQRKLELHPSIAAKPKKIEDSSFKKAPQSSKQVKPSKINEPAYFPVMPPVYAHPYISSSGVVWRPINIMPVVPPGPIQFPNSTHHFGHNQMHSCSCNCHGTSQPLTVNNPISPYAQYVITAPSPYQNSSPKF